MRQLIVKVPEGYGARVLDLASDHQARNLMLYNARDREDGFDAVVAFMDNQAVTAFIRQLEDVTDAHMEITIFPQPVMPMGKPKEDVPSPLADVSPRSPIEIWLHGHQSIGSWKGFLGYALSAAIVVWIGMFTNTIYLIVAAMLIAPFAGPAMNSALATAAGSRELLWDSIVRYFAALAVTALVSMGLSYLFGMDTASPTMVSVSEVSSVAVLLPLVAGAAGALNLVQSENSSLVSGTAAGLLIAASLAPPAGLVGMVVILQRWDMLANAAFILALQLVGINIAGSLVFRLYGLTPEGLRYQRGNSRIFYGSVAVSSLLLAGLLFVQFRSSPDFQRATISQRTVDVVRQEIDESNLATLVEADMRFTRPSTNEDTLLGVVYVQRMPDIALSDEIITEQLTASIQQRLLEAGYNVIPLIDVTVLEPPPATP